MISTLKTSSLNINPTLHTLLSELEEECIQVQSLLTQLKIPTLTDEQKGDILADLVGAVCHLHVHTEDLPDLIQDEIETLPDQ
jgi:hypothetical protein